MDQPTRLESIRVIVEPMIQRATHDLCKEYCRGERNRWRCPIDPGWSRAPRGALTCERSNETYDWLYQDWLGGRKIEKFLDSDAEGITHYFVKTLSSHPFHERFKDMRYGNRVRVPPYILALGAVARRVFWLMREQLPIEAIAQAVQQPDAQVIELVREIHKRLNEHDALRLLRPVIEVALPGPDESFDAEKFASTEPPVEEKIDDLKKERLVKATFDRLPDDEKYVVVMMELHKRSAQSVLISMEQEGKVIVGVNDTHAGGKEGAVQRIYYFCRKAKEHLRQLYEAELRAPRRREKNMGGYTP